MPGSCPGIFFSPGTAPRRSRSGGSPRYPHSDATRPAFGEAEFWIKPDDLDALTLDAVWGFTCGG